MKSNKKAAIEVQFNWIFILIVGAIIIIFFFSIVEKQKTAADIKLASGVLTQLDAITAGAGVSLGSVNELEMPDAGINFICENESCSKIGCFSEYSLQLAEGVKKDYSTEPIFTPTRIEGKNLITWTQGFDVPFRAVNFLYLTSDNVKYYIVYDLMSESKAKSLNKSLPDKLNKELISVDDVPSLRDKGNYKVRLIFYDTSLEPDDSSITLPDLGKTKDEDITALHVTGPTNYVYDLEFFEKDGQQFVSTGTSYALANSSLFGAILSDDIGMYECNMKKAFNRLNVVAGVYAERVSSLGGELFLTDPECAAMFAGEAYFGEIRDSSAALYLSLNGQKLSAIGSAMGNLRTLNRQAIIQSCPTFY